MTAPETSTVTWGETRLPYTIRRSARRKKTVAVTVDPAGCILVVTPERVAAWRAKAGLPVPRVVIADQQKRWGSCDQRGTIRLNWRIIQAPMRLVDYVVVHELVHLRHRGHGRDYWQAVGRVMPDYERRRENLRACGVGLAW